MEASIQNPRRSPRIALRFQVDIVYAGRGSTATTVDIGPGGCLLALTESIGVAQDIELAIHGDTWRDTLVVNGTVVWSRAGHAGVAFAPPANVARAWFRRVLKARPELEAAIARIPDQVPLDAALFALPPDPTVHLENDEAAVIRVMEHGVRVGALLSRCGLPAPRASRSIFALLDKRVLTLSVGEAVEPWRWRAVLQRRDAASPQAARPESTAAPALAVSPPPDSTAAGSFAAAQQPPLPCLERPPRPNIAGDLHSILRGVSGKARAPEAQAALDEAREAASTGEITRAVGLVRRALRLAPRDPEIARLLGELAFSRSAAA